MNLKNGLMSFVACMVCAGSAHAKDAGVEIGARLGFGLPLGDAVGGEGDNNALSDGISYKVPLQVDVGYRLNPQLMIGGYFQYAFGSINDDEDECEADGVDCSASVIRLGAQATYHFTPITAGSAGWIGGGIGYEWLKMSLSLGDQDLQGTLRGFEFVNFQGGYDFVVNDKFRVGPYGLISVGRYGSASIDFDDETESMDVDDKAFHAWLAFGVKATFGAL